MGARVLGTGFRTGAVFVPGTAFLGTIDTETGLEAV
jgi:hypothetical protein